MLKENLLELEKCLIRANNPILPYLDKGAPFDENRFVTELESLNMEVSRDLIDLYNWKSGLPEQPWGFDYQLFYHGTFIHYAETITTYKMVREREVVSGEFDCFLPIALGPYTGAEDPIMINLDKKSSTYGSIYYYSTMTTHMVR
jgi:hypothetical protein